MLGIENQPLSPIEQLNNMTKSQWEQLSFRVTEKHNCTVGKIMAARMLQEMFNSDPNQTRLSLFAISEIIDIIVHASTGQSIKATNQQRDLLRRIHDLTEGAIE